MHILYKMYLTCNKTNFFQWSKSEPDRVLDKLLNYCFVNLGNFELLSTVLNTPVIKQFGLIADAIMTLRQHVIILKRGMLTDNSNTQLFQTCLYCIGQPSLYLKMFMVFIYFKGAGLKPVPLDGNCYHHGHKVL